MQKVSHIGSIVVLNRILVAEHSLSSLLMMSRVSSNKVLDSLEGSLLPLAQSPAVELKFVVVLPLKSGSPKNSVLSLLSSGFHDSKQASHLHVLLEDVLDANHESSFLLDDMNPRVEPEAFLGH